GLAEGLAPLDGARVVVRKDVEVLCDTDEDCDEVEWMADGGEPDADGPQDQIHDKKIIVIRKNVDSE
ncbi:MAG: hypothetical protein PVI22_17545, partial [Lysobacterales bacterium]